MAMSNLMTDGSHPSPSDMTKCVQAIYENSYSTNICDKIDTGFFFIKKIFRPLKCNLIICVHYYLLFNQTNNVNKILCCYTYRYTDFFFQYKQECRPL